jgi:hypothetical protein
MIPDELSEHFLRVETLVTEMNRFAGPSTRGISEFRADLAGMLTVTMAATYESCVKTSMVSYASRHGSSFEEFVERNYEKLNSRISFNDLKKYAKTFDDRICSRFVSIVDRRRQVAVRLTGKSPISQLDQLLKWRHDFAHAGKRQTTIEEAVNTHRLSSIIICSFHKAFMEHPVGPTSAFRSPP